MMTALALLSFSTRRVLRLLGGMACFSWQAGCICPGAELDCTLCLEGFHLAVSRVCVPLLTLMFIVPGATGARPGVAELSLQPRRHPAAPANCPVTVRLRCKDPGSTLLLRAIFECIAVATLLQKVFYHNAAEAACLHLFCHGNLSSPSALHSSSNLNSV